MKVEKIQRIVTSQKEEIGQIGQESNYAMLRFEQLSNRI